MAILMLIVELIGTVAFAVSGAMTGLSKRMDIFGVAILGLTTATGGGVLRDILLGSFPPMMFRNPIYAAVAIGGAIVIFLPVVRRLLARTQRVYSAILFCADTLGLGIFTVVGVQAAYLAGYNNAFLAIFVGTITGVGGGVLRDVLAGNTPYIFVKHIYACAAIAGALVCVLLWHPLGATAAMFAGAGVIVAIRVLAAHFHWSLPKGSDQV
ncbi:MAG: TRIC cation channel family protein [Clostridia bacterium]|nr:TRIC cation channel family protein [Clostridia bacterium]